MNPPRTTSHGNDANEPLLPLSGHQRAIVATLLLNGPSSRTDLVHNLNLSAGSLTRLTRPLIDAGILQEQSTNPTQASIGRPSVPLTLNADRHRFIGIKLTATDSHAALTTTHAEIEHTINTPLSVTDATTVLDLMADQILTLAAHTPHPILGVGVTLGGHVAHYSVVTRADYHGWENLDVAHELQARTGFTIVVDNDIVAHTEYSSWFGQGRGAERFALFTLGAGIGFGVVVHGHAVSTPEAGFSLLSHHRLLTEELLTRVPDPEYVRGSCGHLACARTLFTSGEISRRASLLLGRDVSAPEVLTLAKAGAPLARQLINVSGYALGQFLADVANMVLPERIILGGEMCEIADVARDALNDGLRHFRDSRTTPPALFLDNPDISSWARSAATLAIHDLFIGRGALPVGGDNSRCATPDNPTNPR